MFKDWETARRKPVKNHKTLIKENDSKDEQIILMNKQMETMMREFQEQRREYQMTIDKLSESLKASLAEKLKPISDNESKVSNLSSKLPKAQPSEKSDSNKGKGKGKKTRLS